MAENVIKVKKINKKTRMIYWKKDDQWQGKLVEYPEIMTQGLTLAELEVNLNNAYLTRV
jgi:predicted RNase H-like HicB family nuclease